MHQRLFDTTSETAADAIPFSPPVPSLYYIQEFLDSMPARTKKPGHRTQTYWQHTANLSY